MVGSIKISNMMDSISQKVLSSLDSSFHTVKGAATHLKNSLKKLMLKLFVKFDSGAHNACLIMLMRLFGSVVAFSKENEAITVPTLSASVSKVGNPKLGNSAAEDAIGHYPNFFAPTVVPRLDFVDYMFSCKFSFSRNLAMIFSLLYAPLVPTGWIVYIYKLLLKLYFSYKKESASGEMLGFVLARTACADSFLRWSILYGGAPVLAINKNEAESEMEQQDSISNAKRSIIYLHFPIHSLKTTRLPRLKFKGVSQIVILGAGFDNRAYKFSHMRKEVALLDELQDLNQKLEGDDLHQTLRNVDGVGKRRMAAGTVKGIPVYEIDLKHVQDRKMNLIKANFSDQHRDTLFENVLYVTCDLVKDSLYEKLLGSGLRRGVPTSILFEGVSYYLPAEVFFQTLGTLSAFFCPSTGEDGWKAEGYSNNPAPPNVFLLFDFVDLKVLDVWNDLVRDSTLYQLLPEKNKVNAIDSTTLPTNLKENGWSLIYDWGGKEIKQVIGNMHVFPKGDSGSHDMHMAFCQALPIDVSHSRKF